MNEIPGLSELERLAFNLAGHAAIGSHLDVDVRQLTIEPNGEAQLDFAPLREVCDFRRSPSLRIEECARSYITFALSGIASELVRIEKHYRIGSKSKGRIAFERKWQTVLFEENAMDVDFAYFVASSWLKADETRPVEEKLNLLWAAVYNLTLFKWPDIELVAGRLRADGAISGYEIRLLLGKE